MRWIRFSGSSHCYFVLKEVIFLNDILTQVFSAIGVGFAGIFTVAFGMAGTKLKAFWDRKQLNKALQNSVNDAIAAVEESARTDETLRGQAKLEKAMDFAMADLEANGIMSIKPILLEGKIKSALRQQRLKEGTI